MNQESTRAETVNLLQGLGLKEYEAGCFVALTRLSSGTAKEISEISDVPRTRVYDAIRLLEAQGLVAVQHGSPKRFSAVGIEEATRTLRQKHEARIDTLETQLRDLEPPDDGQGATRQEVWSLSDEGAIQTRTENTIAEADSEIMLLVVEEALLTEQVVERLQAAVDRGVSVIIGGTTDAMTSRVKEKLPGIQVFETGLEWLMGSETDDEVAISRLLLTDREKLLVSSFYPDSIDSNSEQAIFATGLENGVVVLLRRLLATGLLPARDTSVMGRR